MIKKESISVRIKLAVIFIILLFCYLAAVLYNVQVLRHDELFSKAKNKYTSIKTTKGKRGEIFDYAGNLLVGNVPCSDICVDPLIIIEERKCHEVAEFFAKKLNLDYKEIYEKISKRTRKKIVDGKSITKPNRYALIATKIELDVAESLRKEIEALKIKGVFFNESSKRFYPKNTFLANILGFISEDKENMMGVVGIEKFFDKKIAPNSVKISYERSRDGVPLASSSDEQEEAVDDVRDGLNIYLTIKEPIQAILEEELDALVEKWKPKAAYAIMVDPYNGNIIALAQRPTYNPNERNNMNPDAWRNRITEDIFEPGSTMKPFAISGALDAGLIKPETTFDCEKGRWYYTGKLLRDSHPYGTLSVTQIIQKSSNIGTAKVALLMGDQKLHETLKAFGFGQRTGVPLKPETRGIFRPLKDWDRLSITRFPIGQGIAVSPLQLARAYCMLANGGRYLNLRLVDKIENPDTGIVIKPPVDLGFKIFKNKDTQKQIVQMMKLVTQEGGTAKEAAVRGYYSAGKTGTSQKFANGQYSESNFFATFVGFVPADKPAFVMLVTADEPQRAHYGGVVAAPMFSKVSEKALRYMNIPTDYPVEEGDFKTKDKKPVAAKTEILRD